MSNPDAAELRKRAEEQSARSQDSSEPLSLEAARLTLHELRVHQIELEMQNEELRRAQAELDSSRARYFELYDLAPVGYVTISVTGLILQDNLTAATLLGVPRDALAGQPFSRFILKQDADSFYLLRKRLLETGEPQACDLRMVKGDGTPFWAHLAALKALAADGATECRVTLTDSTERILADALLRESNQRYDTFVNALPDMAYLKNERGQHIIANTALLAFFGKSKDEVIGKTDFELMPKDNAQACWESDQKALQSADIVRSEERVNGRDYEPWKFRVRLASGQWGVAGFIRDVTERKRMAKALAEEAGHRRILIEQSRDGIVILDQEGKVAEANRRFAEMLGYTPEEVLLLHVWDWDAQSTREELLGMVGEVDATGAHFETRHRRKDGSFCDVEISSNGSLCGGRKRVLCVCRDITERKLAEAYREMGLEVLHILNEPGDLKCTLGRVLDEVKNRTGADAVGLRLQDGEDFPYLTQQGFSENFLLTENALVERGVDGGVCRDKDGNVCLECTCGLVISGKADPSHPFFTQGGSFWTNDSAPLLDLTPEQDPRHHPRNECIHLGYASVALIPVRDKGRIVGLLHLNARRKGCFTLATVELLENLASHIGEALTRIQAEEALRESAQMVEGIINALPVRVFWKDKQLAYLGCNEIFARDAGFADAKDLIGKDDFQMGWRAQAESYRADDREVIETGRAKLLIEEVQTTPTGEALTLLTSKLPLRDAQGGIRGVLGTYMDITEHKQAMDALRALSVRQEAILAAIPDIIMEVDCDKVYRWANQAGLDFFGDEVIGKEALFYFEGEEPVYRIVQPLFDGDENVIRLASWQRRKDGEKRLLAWSCRVLKDRHGHVAGALSTARDITELKGAEERLHKIEKQFRTLAEAAPVGIYLCDPDGHCQYANPAWCDMAGLSETEALGMGWAAGLHPEDRERIFGGWRHMVESHGQWGLEYRFQTREGKVTWVYGLAAPQYDVSGKIIQYVGINLDITTRKRTDDVQTFLAQTSSGGTKEPFFGALARYLAECLNMDFVCIDRLEGDGLNARTVAVWCDGRFEDNVTYALKDTPCGDVVGKQVCCFPAGVCQFFPRDQVLKDLRAESYIGVTLFGHTGKPVGLIAVIGRGPLANRPLAEAVLKLAAVRAAGEIERLDAEEELQKIQKLQSIGTLAGGIAHDFNNILTGVYGNISFAKDDLPKNHPAYAPLEEAEKSMSRAVRLTKQLLTFAKGGAPVKENMSLESMVDEVARFDLTGSNVSLVCHHDEELWPVDADRGQIQQVVSNLVINARQAMPEGGRLFVTLENADLPDASVPPLSRGRYVKVTVQDEGDGIEPNVIDHIFDPYFTTKQSGNGLGLATVWSIINRHGGHIGVASERGKGTTFTFYLPASESPQSAEAKPPAAECPPPAGPAKILMMDDDECVSRLVVRMLTPCGYAVSTALNAQEALAQYKQALAAGAPFGAVIMDLTIPGGPGGKEVIKDLLALDPGVRAIVSSGYADDPVMANPAKYGFKGTVAKPYTARALRETVARVLK